MLEAKEFGSVSKWLHGARSGDPIATEKIVTRYINRLAEFADAALRRGERLTEDGEDFALSVLQWASTELSAGRLPDLHNRDDLWLFLVEAAQRRIVRKQSKQRSLNQEHPTEMTMTDTLKQYDAELQDLWERGNPGAYFREVIHCWEDIINILPDQTSKDIAVLKLQGFSNREISQKLKLVSRTVDRKVIAIVEKWKAYIEADD